MIVHTGNVISSKRANFKREENTNNFFSPSPYPPSSVFPLSFSVLYLEQKIKIEKIHHRFYKNDMLIVNMLKFV